MLGNTQLSPLIDVRRGHKRLTLPHFDERSLLPSLLWRKGRFHGENKICQAHPEAWRLVKAAASQRSTVVMNPSVDSSERSRKCMNCEVSTLRTRLLGPIQYTDFHSRRERQARHLRWFTPYLRKWPHQCCRFLCCRWNSDVYTYMAIQPCMIYDVHRTWRYVARMYDRLDRLVWFVRSTSHYHQYY